VDIDTGNDWDNIVQAAIVDAGNADAHVTAAAYDDDWYYDNDETDDDDGGGGCGDDDDDDGDDDNNDYGDTDTTQDNTRIQNWPQERYRWW